MPATIARLRPFGPLDAVEIPSTRLGGESAPLLEEERDLSGYRTVPEIGHPLLAHRAEPRP